MWVRDSVHLHGSEKNSFETDCQRDKHTRARIGMKAKTQTSEGGFAAQTCQTFIRRVARSDEQPDVETESAHKSTLYSILFLM